MSSLNPYSSPQTSSLPQISTGPMGGPPVAVFRQGEMVVTHKMAVLPNLCIYNGEPASPERMTVQLQYDEPWVRMMALFGALLYALIAAAASQKASVALPISQSTWDSRWKWTWICWGIAGAGLLAFILGCIGLGIGDARGAMQPIAGVLMLGGFFAMITAPIVAYFAFRQVGCYFMDDHYIWITGAHPNFLAALPAWPFPPR